MKLRRALASTSLSILIANSAVAGVQTNWDTARRLIIVGKTGPAISMLNNIGVAAKSNSKIGHDQIYLNLGRAYYQKGNFDKAIESYNKVLSSSDFWTFAVEETAWAYLAQGKEEKALAKVQSLMSPMFSSVIGSEPYFLKAFAHLRICDYKGVFNTTTIFKKRYAKKIKSLEDIVAKKGESEVLKKLFQSTSQNSDLVKVVTENLHLLPTMAHRDKVIQSEVFEIQKSKGVRSPSVLTMRMVELAKQQLKEIEKHLGLLHVIEAQAIPRVELGKLAGKDYKNGKPKSGSEWLQFPVSSEEVWIDEIDSYHVQVKNCARKRG